MGVCEKYMVKGMIKAGATKDQVTKCRKCKGKIKQVTEMNRNTIKTQQQTTN